MKALPFDDETRRRLSALVRAFDRVELDDEDLVRAAVAFTIVGNDAGDACFVITRRPLDIRRHPGQWALPGGRADPGETASETARRELHEEVGLELPPDALLGALDDYRTRSGFVITPVLFWGPPRPVLVPEPSEVHAAHVVGLEALGAPELPRIVPGEREDQPLICLPVSSLSTTIWAPTAALLYQTRELLLFGRTTRVAHFEQPRFAWR